MIKINENILLKTDALAPIEVEILLFFSLKNKRLQRIAGLAPEKKIWFYYRNRNDKHDEKKLCDLAPLRANFSTSTKFTSRTLQLKNLKSKLRNLKSKIRKFVFQ